MDASWWLALAALVLIVTLTVADQLARRRQRLAERHREVPHGRLGPTPPGPLPNPRPGEIWWARVPYADRHGSKDRPCVVLSATGDWIRVLKVTSRRPTAPRPHVIRLPQGSVDDARGLPSYLETDELRDLPVWDFRRRCGAVSPELWKRIRQLSRS